MWLPRCKNTRQTTKQTDEIDRNSGPFKDRLRQFRNLSTAIFRHGAIGFLVSFCVCTIAITGAYAQGITIDFNEGTSVTERAIQIIALVTVLSLAPSLLVMVTSFTRIVVVLSLLRSAIGLQTAPPNSVMIGLALFLTSFIMMPTLEEAYNAGLDPLIKEEVELSEAMVNASKPFHAFMRGNVREKDLELFQDMSGVDLPDTPEELEMRVLIPAFMISELKRAFEIGFLLYLPFVIIDLVVASILMSMGMMMLPPIVISLPFKLIFFVLVDGWHLVAGSLVRSFSSG
ncbi:MAG: flagellar type III secretion system pore protein FliP [Hyphomicrobiales bacterium]